MTYVVDASVAIKWFIKENFTHESLALLEEENLLIAPDLLYPEMGNVLWKKQQLGEIKAQEALEILRAILNFRIEIHPTKDIMELALKLAQELSRTVYDCLYLALAVSNDCAIVTADRKLYNAVRKSPFKEQIQWVTRS